MNSGSPAGLGLNRGTMQIGMCPTGTSPEDIFPLSCFPVSLAKDTLIGQYIAVGTLAVFCWDIISHLEDEMNLLVKFRIALPVIVYFIARIASFLEVLCSTILLTAPLGSCSQLQRSNFIILVVAVACNSFLFFLRVRAIFSDSLRVVIIFAFLWIMVSAGGATPLIGVTVENIGPTNYCTHTGVPKFVSISMWTAVIYDGAVFIAISSRLLANTYGNNELKPDSEAGSGDNGGTKNQWLPGWVNGFLYGTGLPKFSKVLLKDGQFYYLIVTTINVVVLVLIYAKGPIWTVSFAQTNMFLTNSLTSHVFRKTKIRTYDDSSSSSRNPDTTVGYEFARGAIFTSHFDSDPTTFVTSQSQPTGSGTPRHSRQTDNYSRRILSADNPNHPDNNVITNSNQNCWNEGLLQPSTTSAAAYTTSYAIPMPSLGSTVSEPRLGPSSENTTQDLDTERSGV